jgi:hypothetical protein
MVKTAVCMTALVLGLMLLIGSCKNESDTAGGEFDQQIDGIAVMPMPSIDPELAERINREGPIGPTADIITEADILAEAYAAPTEFAPEPAGAAPEITPGPAYEYEEEPVYTYDANSY